jgi:SAM-dependent methyltransferase
MASAARIASNRLLKAWCAPITGAVLSIGSAEDRDGEGGRYREYFPRATSYTTSDFGEAAARCDVALDIRAMPEIADAAYDAIFCSGVLEHIDELPAALRELWRVLKPGGTLLLGVPFRQAIHRAPQDYWRFTKHGVEHLLSAYVIDGLVEIDATQADFPSAYWVKARKPGAVEVPSLVRSRTGTAVVPDRSAPAPPLESVVCWLWSPPADYHTTYTAAHVNVLRRMVARHYPRPVRFMCVTAQTAGLDREVEVVCPWEDFVGLPGPHGPRFPSCYRRLRAFAPDIADTFGRRFVTLDLDGVILGDLRPLWDRPEDFVIWKDTYAGARYNGSMVLMTAGARTQVWDTFDPATSPAQTLAAGDCNGSDQGWISFVLGRHEATWTDRDGVYSYKNQVKRGSGLPSNARVVFFHGTVKPWSVKASRLSWVRAAYQ